MSADTGYSNLIYLSLGSNLGDRLKNIDAARELIWKRLGNPGVVSQVFESASWGYTSDNLFYNCCLSLTTNLDPISVMDEILDIEKILGRERGTIGYSDRLIDIDLLFFGDLILDHPRLTIPHPSIPQRRFILEPLSKIAPDLIHPEYGIAILTMLEQCKDQGAVRPI
ncbi:MAG: 2-amino-4-hydroxy-6-hydroxymethyldihydropteridine diphosphokinase [Bacteroidetes bacterium]|nr:MAG: 2-amino-4-hydroxy-6-hydroxymethyldihydropteridine diphosphokinase [Bacteroidota bacterium]